MRSLFLVMLLSASAALAGPVSKFDERPPIADFDSSGRLEAIERCLLDIPNNGYPFVYAQPDRPDDVTMIWNPNMDVNARRIDLHRTANGTHIRSWMPSKSVTDCAPR